MKKLILILVTILISGSSILAQANREPMKFMGSQLFQGEMPITLGMARDISMSTSSEAYMHFSKAAKIRGWNIFRGVFGTLETLGGLNNVAQGYSVGLIDLGIGAGCIVSIFPREQNRKRYIMMGVNAYNASLSKN